MEEYTAFAYIYDEFMDNIPYEECCAYLLELLKDNKINDGTIVELGCGTGRITRELARHGYDVVGIDLSEDMLTQAQSFDNESEGVIIYSHQDMREFSVPYKVNGVVSISDSMNYIRNVEDLKQVFDRVYECLEDGGVFIFDLKTDHFFKKVVGNATRTDIREDAVLIWENEYDENKRDNTYYLTMFIEESEDEPYNDEPEGDVYDGEDNVYDNPYRRYEEVHVQHAYTREEIDSVLRASGLEPIYAYEAYGRIIATNTSERIYYIARK